MITNMSSRNGLIVVHVGAENGFLEDTLLIYKGGKASGGYQVRCIQQIFRNVLSKTSLFTT